MRELKFRAWSGKIMHYNVGVWDEHAVVEEPGYEFNELRTRGWKVMQYTGLKDNTQWDQLSASEQEEWLELHTKEEWCGKEIYEGDILIDSEAQYVEVVWFLHGWKYKTYLSSKNAKTLCTSIFFNYPSGYCEIAGNIHENPELLED